MSLQTTTLKEIPSTNIETVQVKNEIYRIIEQWPVAWLPLLLSFLQPLFQTIQKIATNGTEPPVLNPTHQITPVQERPWMEAVRMLKDSPNWDEFEADLVEIRREANEMESVA